MDERHKRSNRNNTITVSGRSEGRDEDRNGWREDRQASAEARSLTTVRKRAEARSPINYNLDPPLFSFLSHTLSAPFNHPPPASYPPLVPLLCSYKSISSPSLLQPRSHPSTPSTFPLSLCFLFIGAVGVERSEVGRREGEKVAEATREWENESVFNQSGVGADNIFAPFSPVNNSGI